MSEFNISGTAVTSDFSEHQRFNHASQSFDTIETAEVQGVILGGMSDEVGLEFSKFICRNKSQKRRDDYIVFRTTGECPSLDESLARLNRATEVGGVRNKTFTVILGAEIDANYPYNNVGVHSTDFELEVEVPLLLEDFAGVDGLSIEED